MKPLSAIIVLALLLAPVSWVPAAALEAICCVDCTDCGSDGIPCEGGDCCAVSTQTMQVNFEIWDARFPVMGCWTVDFDVAKFDSLSVRPPSPPPKGF